MSGTNPTIRAALLQQRGNGRLDPEVRGIADELVRRGIPHELFFEKHLHRRRLALSPDVLVAGHIPTVVAAVRQLGVEPPPPDDYPAALRPWLRRHVWTSTVGAIVQRLQDGRGGPLFVKPAGRLKRFTGRVLESWDDLRYLAGAGDRAPVLCAEVVTWLTEYRVFVTRGTIVGIRHYLGDPTVSADRGVIEAAVAAFEASGEALAGYGIDFGVLADGTTALIEVNEGYGLGAYGLGDAEYTDVIIARWCEMTQWARARNPLNGAGPHGSPADAP